MKTREEQRFDLVCAALSGLCANAQPGIPASEYGKSAVSFADAAMKEIESTVNECEHHRTEAREMNFSA